MIQFIISVNATGNFLISRTPEKAVKSTSTHKPAVMVPWRPFFSYATAWRCPAYAICWSIEI